MDESIDSDAVGENAFTERSDDKRADADTPQGVDEGKKKAKLTSEDDLKNRGNWTCCALMLSKPPPTSSLGTNSRGHLAKELPKTTSPILRATVILRPRLPIRRRNRLLRTRQM